MGLMLDRVRGASPRHQPVVQRDIARGQMGDERPIDTHETSAIVKIGYRKPVREDKIGHVWLLRESEIGSQRQIATTGLRRFRTCTIDGPLPAE